MRLASCLFYLFFLWTSIAWPQSKIPRFEKITTEQGLASTVVYAIEQDQYGFMWFGTEAGLSRYDGYTVKTYQYSPQDSSGISYNDIGCLFEDKQGNFWVGTYGGGLDLYDRNIDGFVHFREDPKDPQALRDNSIAALFEDSKGNFWVGTSNGGAHIFDRKKQVFRRIPINGEGSGTLGKDVRGFAEDKEGNIWIATFDQGVSVYHPKENNFTYFSLGHLPVKIINTVYCDRNGTIWVGTNRGGLCKYLGEGKGFKVYSPDEKKPYTFPHDQVMSIQEDKEGKVWFATYGGGVAHYVPEKDHFISYAYTEQLAANTVLNIHFDRENTLWCGTYGEGVNYYDTRKNYFYRIEKGENGLKVPRVNELLLAQDKIYIGTYGGGLNIRDNQTGKFQYITETSKPLGIDNNEVGALMLDSNGRLWVGTDREGVTVYKGKRKLFEFKEDKGNEKALVNKSINDIVEDKEGNIWMSSVVGGVTVFNAATAELESYTEEYLMMENGIRCMIEGPEGDIWLGSSDEGVVVIDPSNKQIRKVFRADGENPVLTDNGITDFYKDQEGNIWIGTVKGGLIKYAPYDGVFHPVEHEMIINSSIRSIEQDQQGVFWLGTLNGIIRYNPATGKCRKYDENDGLLHNEFTFGASGQQDGVLYFGTLGGIVYFDPREIELSEGVAGIIITDFKVFNQSVTPGDNTGILKKNIALVDTINIDYTHSVFSLEFVSANLTNTNRVHYRHRLRGFTEQWMNTENRQATFTNLSPGTYTFQVMASNPDGYWGAPKSTTIIITPPFWMTWWFRILLLLLLGAMGYGVYAYRVRRILVQKKILTETVRERTSKVLAQNVEIQRQAEELSVQRDIFKDQSESLEKSLNELAFKNEQIMQSLAYAETIQQAFMPSEEQMKETLKDYFLLYKAKDIISGDFYWVAKEEDYTFVAVVDCTGHGVPGGLMSMIGTNLLNKAVKERKLLDPEKILDYLKEEIYYSLKQDQGNNTDGMDIALCRLKQEEGQWKMVFAGSKSHIYCYSKESKQMKRLKGDSLRIGGRWKKSRDRRFNAQTWTLSQGDILYLVTDGIVDQNNESNQRFRSFRLEQLLETCSQVETMEKQKMLVERIFQDFVGDTLQRDDITLLGIRMI
ncbi:two-component regulator propeller domain-containing protein [Algivirga pacifica]|uniref:PPM-type phosphatase domain-containing protein n=1 Tax=Algivirga pacifica TaxID=1162670 RepID=A0ABP9D9K7_9BACT